MNLGWIYNNASPFTILGELAGYYGGDRIAVPRGRAVMRAVRDKAIRQLHDKGHSVSELALAFGLTERRIWMHTEKHSAR